MTDDASISLPVPPQIATAWRALPPERRASFARAMVEAWLEPLLLRPMESPVFVPYHTLTAGQEEARPSECEMFRALCRQLGIPRAYPVEEVAPDELPYYAPAVLHQARWSCVLGQTAFYFDHQGHFLGMLGDPHDCGWWPREAHTSAQEGL